MVQQGPKINMKNEAGLGLTSHYIQQDLISAYEVNCPLRIARTGKYSLKWKPTLESLRREIRRLYNKSCRAGTPQAGNSIKRLSGDIERR